MFYKWFKGVKYAEDGKSLYRTLARENHPDNGGNEELLKQITVEFKEWWKEHKNIHHTASTADQGTADQGTADQGRKYKECNIDEFIDIINKLVIVPGIEIEICGTWVWISGNSYPYKEYLKEIGCRWSKGKKKWFWTNDYFDPRKKYGIHPSMETIRAMHGSTKVHREEKPQIGKDKD